MSTIKIQLNFKRNPINKIEKNKFYQFFFQIKMGYLKKPIYLENKFDFIFKNMSNGDSDFISYNS